MCDARLFSASPPVPDYVTPQPLFLPMHNHTTSLPQVQFTVTVPFPCWISASSSTISTQATCIEGWGWLGVASLLLTKPPLAKLVPILESSRYLFLHHVKNIRQFCQQYWSLAIHSYVKEKTCWNKQGVWELREGGRFSKMKLKVFNTDLSASKPQTSCLILCLIKKEPEKQPRALNWPQS